MGIVDENRTLIEGFWADLYRQDLEAAAARFAPDGEYTDVETPEDDVARGPDEIVRRLTLAFGKLDRAARRAPAPRRRRHRGHDRARRALGLADGRDHGAARGLGARGARRRITRWCDYWDMNVLVAAAPQWWFEHVLAGWK